MKKLTQGYDNSQKDRETLQGYHRKINLISVPYDVPIGISKLQEIPFTNQFEIGPTNVEVIKIMVGLEASCVFTKEPDITQRALEKFLTSPGIYKDFDYDATVTPIDDEDKESYCHTLTLSSVDDSMELTFSICHNPDIYYLNIFDKNFFTEHEREDPELHIHAFICEGDIDTNLEALFQFVFNDATQLKFDPEQGKIQVVYPDSEYDQYGLTTDLEETVYFEQQTHPDDDLQIFYEMD